jgi:hypothetical protein
MRPALRVAALVTLCGVAAVAQATEPEADACASSEWPLDVELGWMKASSIETLQSGAKLSAVPSKAFAVTLTPSASVVLPAPPSGKPHGEAAETWAGFVNLAEIPKAGLYQVTLSGPGWIDVVQNGAVVATQAHTSLHACPTVRKSIRFQLASGPASAQFSSVPAATIKFAIRRAD